MSALKENLAIIFFRWDRIYIRAQVDGKWGSHTLSELDDKTIAEWIRDYILPKHLEATE